MSLETFGIALREARQARGLSVEQVANSLKINLRVLRAFEEWDLGALPQTVYVRGFARDYGLYLGLSEADMAPALAELGTLGEIDSNALIPTVYTPPSATTGLRFGRGKVWLVLLLTLCLAGAGLAWVYRDAEFFSDIQLTRFLPARPASSVKPAQQSPSTTKKQEPITQSTGPSTAAQSTAQSAPAPSPQPGQATQPAQSRATQQASQQAPQQVQTAHNAPHTPASQPTSPPADNQIVMPQPAPPSSLQAQNTPARTQPAGQHKLVITALAECWVHSSADDADIRQFSLRKGDTFALTFSDKLSLKLGNAGGVRIRYNGTDLPPPGKEGQVRILTFPPTE